MPRKIKAEIEATELFDVKVKQVSLVKRGANMLPIKIQKSEDQPMSIDFSNLFKRDIVAPTVATIIVSKGADLDRAKRLIEGAGFSIEKSEEVEGNIFFAQSDADYKENGVAIKFDKDVVAIVANVPEEVQKGFHSWDSDSTEFQELLSQEGFYDSVHTARYALGTAIGNIMHKSDDSGEAADQIEKAVADFGTYVTKLVKAIPVAAFKLEDIDVLKSADGPAADEAGGETSTEETNADRNSDSNNAAGNGTNGEAEGQNNESADEPEGSGDSGDGDGGKTVVKSADETLLGGVKELLGTFKTEISTEISGLATSVKEVQANLNQVSKEMSAVKEVAKSAGDAVAGMVGGEAGDDKLHKSDSGDGDAIPAIDTAYS